MEIYHQYVKLRKQFGRHPKFSDEALEMLADIRPNEEHAQEYVARNPVFTVTQCVPEMSEHEANTNAVLYNNRGMSHLEGGWPKDIDYTEAEHTIRYRKKVEKDEDYLRTVAALGAGIERLVKQNNAIDIYEEYFDGLVADHSAEVPSTKTTTVLKEPQYGASRVARPAVCLDWHPDGAAKVAVAYAIMSFQQQPPNMPLSSYVWDTTNPNSPEYEMAPASQVCCCKFNLKDPCLVGAGQYNGQVACFDMRKGSAAADVTLMDRSHRDPVYDFAWLQSKTGAEAMSVSTDGNVFWWDLRKLAEPVEELALHEKGSDTLLGAVSLEYDPAAGPTKFMIGTEQGVVLSCNRKAKNPADRVGSSYPGHHGPVYGLARNPFFPKYFLSTGDWTARVWNEDLKTPLMTSRYHTSYLMGGAWSPTRPGVFFTLNVKGVLDVWDLFYNHKDPILQAPIAQKPLTSVALHDAGGLCAVGAGDGSTTILQLSAGLVDMAQNEKQGINAMLERETLREKNLEKAIKEAKVKARREAARKDELADTFSAEDEKALEQSFLDQTKL